MATVDNIAIRQTWIEEQTEKLASELDESEDDAFLILGASLLLGCSPDDIELEDIVDGAHDKQIDFIHIEDNTDASEAEVTIIQSKNTRGFSSNTVIQIKNGLSSWIFEKPRAQFSRLENESFKSKINEIREIKTAYGPANLTVRVFHVANGDASTLAAEYTDEANSLREQYANVGFAVFEFQSIGAHELIEFAERGRQEQTND